MHALWRRLIFAGKQMNDDKMAKEYNIEGGSVLHLVRGGAGRRLQGRRGGGRFAWHARAAGTMCRDPHRAAPPARPRPSDNTLCPVLQVLALRGGW